MEKIYYVTGNKGKVLSAKKYLGDIEVEMIDYDFIEPDVNDIKYTAEWKVKKAYEMLGKSCIALDSGFYIPNYPKEENFPGAFVKRKLIEGIGLDGLLEDMKEVDDRYCYFLECLAYYDGENLEFFYGRDEGTIARSISDIEKTVNWSNLSRVYIPYGFNKTLAEMTEEEKNNRIKSTHAFLEFR